MLKVLLVRNTQKYNLGGAELYQIKLAQQLKKYSIEPIIVTSSTKLLRESKKLRIHYIGAPYLSRQNWSGYRNLFLGFYILWQIYLIIWYLFTIIRNKPDILHLQSRDDFIAGTIAGRITRTKVIWTDHSDLRLIVWENVNKKWKNPIGKFILKYLSHIPYKITTISDYEYKSINNLIYPKKLENLIVIKNGAIDKFNEYKDIKSAPMSVCYVGRIIYDKGISEIIEAYKIIQSKYSKITFHLYGDGPDFKRYKSCTKGLNGIYFHGYTNNPLMAIAKNTIFVLPSYHEGLSLSLLDASMMMKAIITTDVDGNPEVIIHNKTGILIPPRNHEALASAIEELLLNIKKREKIAQGSRRFYEENFNFSKIVKNQILPIYLE